MSIVNEMFLESIHPDALESLPLHVLLTDEMPRPPRDTRSAPSDRHHAEGYTCESFYKAISRCVGE
jgi:hypothetical protein